MVERGWMQSVVQGKWHIYCNPCASIVTLQQLGFLDKKISDELALSDAFDGRDTEDEHAHVPLQTQYQQATMVHNVLMQVLGNLRLVYVCQPHPNLNEQMVRDLRNVWLDQLGWTDSKFAQFKELLNSLRVFHNMPSRPVVLALLDSLNSFVDMIVVPWDMAELWAWPGTKMRADVGVCLMPLVLVQLLSLSHWLESPLIRLMVRGVPLSCGDCASRCDRQPGFVHGVSTNSGKVLPIMLGEIKSIGFDFKPLSAVVAPAQLIPQMREWIEYEQVFLRTGRRLGNTCAGLPTRSRPSEITLFIWVQRRSSEVTGSNYKSISRRVFSTWQMEIFIAQSSRDARGPVWWCVLLPFYLSLQVCLTRTLRLVSTRRL